MNSRPSKSTPTTDMAGGATSYLKAQTRALHRHVEQLPYNQRLIAGEAGRVRYTAHLNAIHRVQTALEESLEDARDGLSAVFWRSDRSKLEWLEHDLDVLGQPGERPAWWWNAMRAARSLASQIEAPQHPARRIGALYVLEGSMLGGVLIDQALKRSAAFAELRLRYHRGRGRHTQWYWQEFCKRFDLAICTPRERNEACDGARMCFRGLSDIFEALS